MDQFGHSQNTGTAEETTTILFLGLYLLVLAFFILLVSISTFEDVKSREVMNSLTSTFADVKEATTEPVNFSSKSGELLGPEAFLTMIEGVFTTTIKVDQVSLVQSGRIMAISFHARELFDDNEAQLKPARHELIDRIVASLASAARGTRFEMVFLMGAGVDNDSDQVVEETLEMKRVGVFLRSAVERGADPASLSGGIMPGDVSNVTIKFFILGEVEADNKGSAVQSSDTSLVLGTGQIGPAIAARGEGGVQ